MSATDSSTITANLPVVAISGGLVALSGAVSYTRNFIGTTIDAQITDANVTSTGGSVLVQADSTATASASTLAVAVAAGIGAAVSVSERAWRSAATRRRSSARMRT